MIYRISRIGLAIIFIACNLTVNAGEIIRVWSVTPKSSLKILGVTNVSSFGCSSGYENRSDMISERWDPKSKKWEISGSIHLGIAQFECNNRIMSKDFRNTLKYKRYPDIKIEFLHLKEVMSIGQHRKFEGWVEVTLAGNSHRYFMKSDLYTIDDRFSIFRGTQVSEFSDFELEPPQKGFGSIRVKNEITVNFELILEQVNFSKN